MFVSYAFNVSYSSKDDLIQRCTQICTISQKYECNILTGFCLGVNHAHHSLIGAFTFEIPSAQEQGRIWQHLSKQFPIMFQLCDDQHFSALIAEITHLHSGYISVFPEMARYPVQMLLRINAI